MNEVISQCDLAAESLGETWICSVQKTHHQMLQFSECNCLGDLCSLLSWQGCSWLWSQLADVGEWLQGVTGWWKCSGANNWFFCLLWVWARAIADNCQWCGHWFNSRLAGKWSDGETLLVTRISGYMIYVHWWLGERGSSGDWVVVMTPVVVVTPSLSEPKS